MSRPKLFQLENGRYVFRLPSGELSKSFFWADEFDGAFAIVQDELTSGFRYLNKRGTLSEEFETAGGYSDGYAVVRKDDSVGFQFRDIHGILSEEFYGASNYINGYAKVMKTKKSKIMYRDILGNISAGHAFIGDLAYEYITEKISVYELPDICFLDENFFKLLLAVEPILIKRSVLGAEDDKLNDLIAGMVDYILDRAYKAKVANKEIPYPPTDEKTC